MLDLNSEFLEIALLSRNVITASRYKRPIAYSHDVRGVRDPVGREVQKPKSDTEGQTDLHCGLPAVAGIKIRPSVRDLREPVVVRAMEPCDQVTAYLFSVSAVVMRNPWRNSAIDPLLELDDSCSHDREHHQAGKNLLGLHHLPGGDQ